MNQVRGAQDTMEGMTISAIVVPSLTVANSSSYLPLGEIDMKSCGTPVILRKRLPDGERCDGLNQHFLLRTFEKLIFPDYWLRSDIHEDRSRHTRAMASGISSGRQ